jgi:hypothetical protein
MPPYNSALIESKSKDTKDIMEAERLNQIEGTVADLRTRLSELRRYL